jgi:hypothetical protein
MVGAIKEQEPRILLLEFNKTESFRIRIDLIIYFYMEISKRKCATGTVSILTNIV